MRYAGSLLNVFLSCLLLSWISNVAAEHLPLAFDLRLDSRLSQQHKVPILLMISQDHCPYCGLIKQEILQPMLVSGDYQERVLIRELLIDQGETVINFAGQSVDAAEFAHGYGVHLTPTLLFLNPQGEELESRMIGINTVELYSFYLDSSIDRAQLKMQAFAEQ